MTGRDLGDKLVAGVVRPEGVTVALLLLAFVVGASLSEFFLDGRYLLDTTSNYMEVGLIALAMTLVIVSGNIDLSVASNLALTAVVCGKLHADLDVPMPVVACLYPLVGGALGAFNGLVITRLGLPSLTVTLGTLALYRGLAQVLAGDASIGGFPAWFVGANYRYVGPVPLPLIVFAGFAVAFALVLHRTTFGRTLYAVGLNEPAARFSGLRVDAATLGAFTLAGVMAGIGAMLMTSRQSVAYYDMATGGDGELAIITVVVLGGTDIFGGRGTIFGTVVALFLLGLIRRGMGLASWSPEYQLLVTGTLLVAAVLLGRLAGAANARLAAASRRRHNPPESPEEPP